MTFPKHIAKIVTQKRHLFRKSEKVKWTDLGTGRKLGRYTLPDFINHHLDLLEV